MQHAVEQIVVGDAAARLRHLAPGDEGVWTNEQRAIRVQPDARQLVDIDILVHIQR